MVSIIGKPKSFLIFLAGIGFLSGLSGAHGQGIFVPNRMHGFGVQMNGAVSEFATGRSLRDI